MQKYKFNIKFKTKVVTNFQASLERQLQFASLDDNVGEIKQVDFKRIQHSLSCYNDLFRLFFHG